MVDKATIKGVVRPLRDITYAFFGFSYDFWRYFVYGGWRSKHRSRVRDYQAVKIYHRLEKSLSFRQRDQGAGWGAASALYTHLKKYTDQGKSLTHHERIGLKVLADFLSESDAQNSSEFKCLADFVDKNRALASSCGGVLDKEIKSLTAGRLENPKDFFLSRYSVRDFAEQSVSVNDIEMAISMASNSPSVCNRQSAFVYSLHNREIIDNALKLQNGNRGFGHEIPCLLILCADLSAFDTAGERYQHWIDGGMFSMSVVWALHSLGLSSCCLNWSKGPVDDVRFRHSVNIKPEHTVLMMLAVGYPRENIRVCCSERNPIKSYFKCLD